MGNSARVPRIVGSAVALVVVLALAAALIAWLTMRASLPELDGERSVDGLSAAVAIERDANGVTTVSAPNRPLLAFALGYAHAQDRFFQMDLLRRRSAGRLAELVGRAALPLDRRNRLHRFDARAATALDAMDRQTRAVLEGYARGVNAGLSGLGSRPPEYWLLASGPEPWRDRDALLVLYSMYLELNDSRARRDVSRGFAAAALPPALFAWIYPPGSEWDAPLSGPASPPVPMPGPQVIDLRGADATPVALAVNDRREGLPGSNNWAVAGSRTAHGAAIVANDMHLGLDSPNIWYRARLLQRSEGPIDVSGVTLPGTPFVVTGSNGRVAWAFTNSYGDWTDAVLLRPGKAPGSYLTADGERAFEIHEETLRASDGSVETLRIRETIWGPVVEDYDYPDGEIAISWIAHHARAANVRHLDLESAATLPEALAVAASLGIPPQNFVAGDADGRIGWSIAGQIPVRGGARADRPADWSNGTGWQGWLDAADYPRVVDPENGILWTANSRVASGADLARIGDGGYDLGARGRQIRDRLAAGGQFAERDMLAIQLDDRALFLARWRDLAVELLDAEATAGRPGRKEFADVLRDWIPRAAIDSVGYRLVREFRHGVRDRFFDALTDPVRQRFGDDAPRRMSNQFEAPLWQAVTERPAHLVVPGHESWRAFLLSVVDGILEDYAQNYSGPLSDRRWGEYNQVQFRHPLSRAVPALASWVDLPAAVLAGDSEMPRVQGRTFGASERFAVAAGFEADGYLHMPGGASAHPLSPYRAAGHDDWVSGRPSAFLPGPPAHRLDLTPSE